MLSAAAYAGMFLFGIVMALVGAVLPVLSARLRFDLAQAGTLFLAMNFTMLVASAVSGPLMDRFGMKPPLVAGPLATGGALIVIARAASFDHLVAAVVLLGAGGGALNGATNTLVADLHDDPKRKNAALNLLGVFFGFGALFLPFLIGSLVDTLGLEAILHMAAGLCAAVALYTASLGFPAPKQARQQVLSAMGRFLRVPLVLIFGAMLFFQSGNEFILGGYLSTFLAREHGASVSAASYLLAGYWATLMVTRVFLSRLLLRVRGEMLVAACAGAAAAAASAAVLSPSLAAAAVAMLITGVALAGIFPTVLGVAGAHFREFSGTVFGILFTMALTGGMTLPWAAGRISESHGLRTGLGLVAAGFAMILVLGLAAMRKTR